MRILAIDVGIGVCGYVVCEIKNLEIFLIKEGEIVPEHKFTLPQKISYIFNKLKEEVNTYKAEAIIVEKLYSHHRHPTTLGVLAQVRGVVALLSEQAKVKFFEYSSTRARKSLLGEGNADSFRVKRMAENVTGKNFRSVHTADAFSLAVAFSHEQKLRRILKDSPCKHLL